MPKIVTSFIFLQAYTYGICGPLKLVPSDAVVIDQCYNGGFMIGRLSGIFISKCAKPRTMIIVSLIGCLSSAAALVTFGGILVIAVYIGTCELFCLTLI